MFQSLWYQFLYFISFVFYARVSHNTSPWVLLGVLPTELLQLIVNKLEYQDLQHMMQLSTTIRTKVEPMFLRMIPEDHDKRYHASASPNAWKPITQFQNITHYTGELEDTRLLRHLKTCSSLQQVIQKYPNGDCIPRCGKQQSNFTPSLSYKLNIFQHHAQLVQMVLHAHPYQLQQLSSWSSMLSRSLTHLRLIGMSQKNQTRSTINNHAYLLDQIQASQLPRGLKRLEFINWPIQHIHLPSSVEHFKLTENERIGEERVCTLLLSTQLKSLCIQLTDDTRLMINDLKLQIDDFPKTLTDIEFHNVTLTDMSWQHIPVTLLKRLSLHGQLLHSFWRNHLTARIFDHQLLSLEIHIHACDEWFKFPCPQQLVSLSLSHCHVDAPVASLQHLSVYGKRFMSIFKTWLESYPMQIKTLKWRELNPEILLLIHKMQHLECLDLNDLNFDGKIITSVERALQHPVFPASLHTIHSLGGISSLTWLARYPHITHVEVDILSMEVAAQLPHIPHVKAMLYQFPSIDQLPQYSPHYAPFKEYGRIHSSESLKNIARHYLDHQHQPEGVWKRVLNTMNLF